MSVLDPDLQWIIDEQQPISMGVMLMHHPDLQWLINEQ
jgi:hypothetical protein